MAHGNTILWQFLALFPRHEFEKIRREVQPKVHARALSPWTQFVAMLSGQLAGRDSLRGMVDALAPQGRKLYHLGMGSVSRAGLARANGRTPAVLFERVFAALLNRCREFAPNTAKKFRFKERAPCEIGAINFNNFCEIAIKYFISYLIISRFYYIIYHIHSCPHIPGEPP